LYAKFAAHDKSRSGGVDALRDYQNEIHLAGLSGSLPKLPINLDELEVLGWKKLGLEQRLGNRIVTYADDLVILCKKGKADEALQQLRKIMSKLKLTRPPPGETARHAAHVSLPGREFSKSHWVTQSAAEPLSGAFMIRPLSR
jgi:hypothetical protein